MNSALYTGTVRHRRTGAQQPGSFEHRITLALLDLDELPGLLDGLLVRRRPGLVRVRARDLLGGTLTPQAARDLAAEHLEGPAPDGPVRVLTHPRAFGVCFNPVSFYYVHDAGERLRAVIAEVTSTPWGEKRSYVLEAGEGGVVRGEHAKALHVSPFQPMDRRHVWAATAPGPTLSVHIANHDADGGSDFDATLGLVREPLTRTALAHTALRHPGGALRTLGLIYGHALGLKLRGARHFRHPGRRVAA